MPRVIFKFDKEKDLYNIWETCNFKSKWGNDFKRGISQNIIQLCEGKNFPEIKEILSKYQEKPHSLKIIPFVVDSFNNSWKEINDEFFKRLEKVMKKPICCNEITAYLTLVGRCPYDYTKDNPYFFVHFFGGIPSILQTAAHEIMHIQFHNTYWPEIEKQIGKEKTADLKEALTTLLNLEFRDLWFVQDKGYEPHQELRKFIEEEWKKKPDFDILMEKCVKHLS